MTKKETLKEKFVELGAKIPIISRKYVGDRDEFDMEITNFANSVINQTSFKDFIVNTFDSDTKHSINTTSKQFWILDGLPFVIIKKGIERSFNVQKQKTIFINNDYRQSTTKHFCEDSSIVFPTAIGPMKKEVYRIVEEQNKLKDDVWQRKLTKKEKKIAISVCEKDVKYGNCIKKNNNYFYNVSVESKSITVYYYILQYKDLWVEISKEEKNQLLLDIEKLRANELLSELTTLNVPPNNISNVSEKIINIIVDQLGIDKHKVTNKANFKTDLCANSLDIVGIILELQKEFNLPINYKNDYKKIKTVGDIIKYVEKHQQKRYHY